MTKKPAIERMTDPCPSCGAAGNNRIWECGSMEVSGEFVQGKACREAQDD